MTDHGERDHAGLLLAEELLLLFLDDESGAVRVDATSADYALAGAVLTELVLAERVGITEKQGWRHPAKVQVGVVAPTQDDVLDLALERMAAKSRTPDAMVPHLAKGLRAQLIERLKRRELVRQVDKKVFWVIPTRRYPAAGGGHVEDDIRQRVRRVLLGQAMPDVRTAALIGLLSAVEQAHKVIGEVDRATAKQVRARAKEIAQGEAVPAAVRSAVQASQAAVGAAVVAATTAATVAST
jgi:hypothetical protein